MFQKLGIPTVIPIALGAIPGALIRYLVSAVSPVAFAKDFSYYGIFFSISLAVYSSCSF